MTRDPEDRSSKFPTWVALASLGLALWLFFANAVPAARERAELEALEADLVQLRARYDSAIHEARLARGAGARQDLQGLLVAIDRLGLTPAELCALHPEAPRSPAPAATAPADTPPADGDGPRTKFP
jgi:hypothetical protein